MSTLETLRAARTRYPLATASAISAAYFAAEQGTITEEQAWDRIARAVAGAPLSGAVPRSCRGDYLQVRASRLLPGPAGPHERLVAGEILDAPRRYRDEELLPPTARLPLRATGAADLDEVHQ